MFGASDPKWHFEERYVSSATSCDLFSPFRPVINNVFLDIYVTYNETHYLGPDGGVGLNFSHELLPITSAIHSSLMSQAYWKSMVKGLQASPNFSTSTLPKQKAYAAAADHHLRPSSGGAKSKWSLFLKVVKYKKIRCYFFYGIYEKRGITNIYAGGSQKVVITSPCSWRWG